MDIKEKIHKMQGDDFFKEEIRCGYKVSQKSKKIWAIELDLLNELLRVCNKHNIKTIAYAGTLLGAVRHKGMIPWDDDIDVAMSRRDFEKLLAVAGSEFQEPYFFQTAETDPKHFMGYARLRNSLTTGYILSAPIKDYNQGIYIDIFVLDGYIKNKVTIQLFKRRICEYILNLYGGELSGKNRLMTAVRHTLYYTICKFLSYKRMCNKYNSIISKYSQESQTLSLMTHSRCFVDRYIITKKELESIDYLPFENMDIPVPSNYDVILSRTYGDYMVFPPVEKRGAWHEGIIEFDPDTPYKVYLEKKYEKNS